MRCDEARRLLLEAEPAELDRAGASPLSRHLAGCRRCAAAAEAILRAEARLNAFLDAPVDEGAVEAIVARVAVPTPHRSRAWRRRGAWSSLALAAAAAGVFFATRPAPPPSLEMPRLAAAPEVPLVEDAGVSDVAIIQTDNPDITVLWFF